MKVKLLNIHQLSSKLIIVKALHEIEKMGLKEAKDYTNDLFARGEKEVTIDVKTTKLFAENLLDELGINYVFVDDDKCPTHDQGAAPQLQEERKLQEVTNDELGVSIYSVDEMSIAWQRKMLFTREQATRVIAGLLDARINVTETHVVHEDNKVTMLTIVKNFPSGTRKKDLERFEHLTSDFVQAVCATMSLEDMLERVKEDAIKAFNELRDYE